MNIALKEYVFRIIIAALICSVVKNFSGSSSSLNSIIKTLCSLLLTITILSPIVKLDYSNMINSFLVFSEDTRQVVTTGTNYSINALNDSIKEKAEAYILDKASLYNAELSVEVKLSDEDLPVPYTVTLKGQISPSAKSKLIKIISDDLGIPKENQTWI